MKIEAIFGGLVVIAAFVAAVYVVFLSNGRFTGQVAAPAQAAAYGPVFASVEDCRSEAWRMAGEEEVDETSDSWRAGHAACLAAFGEPGGAAWLDGWTAARSLCACFDGGYRLAGSDVGVMSAQFRTGFEQCRANMAAEGGDAWTAGWNARLSAQSYMAGCRQYLRGAF